MYWISLFIVFLGVTKCLSVTPATLQDEDRITGAENSPLKTPNQKDIEKLRNLAQEIAEKALFDATSHRISSDYYSMMDQRLSYVSTALAVVSSVSAGGLMVDHGRRTGYKTSTTAISGLAQAFITHMENTPYTWGRLSDDHRRADVDLQDLRLQLMKWYEIKVNDENKSLEELINEYDDFLDTKKKIEEKVNIEKWTFEQVKHDMALRDSRDHKGSNGHDRQE